jgi:hypothetical protein
MALSDAAQVLLRDRNPPPTNRRRVRPKGRHCSERILPGGHPRKVCHHVGQLPACVNTVRWRSAPLPRASTSPTGYFDERLVTHRRQRRSLMLHQIRHDLHGRARVKRSRVEQVAADPIAAGLQVTHSLSRQDSAATDPTYAQLTRQPLGWAGLVHLRWATGGLPVVPENTHPFTDGDYAFAHNGNIKPIARLEVCSRPRRQKSWRATPTVSVTSVS